MLLLTARRGKGADLSALVVLVSQPLSCHKTSWSGTDSHHGDFIVLITEGCIHHPNYALYSRANSVAQGTGEAPVLGSLAWSLPACLAQPLGTLNYGGGTENLR